MKIFKDNSENTIQQHSCEAKMSLAFIEKWGLSTSLESACYKKQQSKNAIKEKFQKSYGIDRVL